MNADDEYVPARGTLTLSAVRYVDGYPFPMNTPGEDLGTFQISETDFQLTGIGIDAFQRRALLFSKWLPNISIRGSGIDGESFQINFAFTDALGKRHTATEQVLPTSR